MGKYKIVAFCLLLLMILQLYHLSPCLPPQSVTLSAFHSMPACACQLGRYYIKTDKLKTREIYNLSPPLLHHPVSTTTILCLNYHKRQLIGLPASMPLRTVFSASSQRISLKHNTDYANFLSKL